MKISDLLKLDTFYSNEEKKIIISFLLGCNKFDLITYNKNIDNNIEKKYKELIKSDLPIQYLLKESFFLNNKFYVNENVLIPRFETEQLVIDVNDLIKKHFKDNVRIIDIGTGSGCIAISLKKLNKNYNVVGTDISNKALKVAYKNAEELNCDIKFIKRNMLNLVYGKFDVIVSNPPYLSKNDTSIEEKVLKYEPHLALFGDIKYYDEILKTCKKNLNKRSIIAFEIGYNQKIDINNLVNKYFPDSKIINKCDLNGYDRYIYILNNIIE